MRKRGCLRAAPFAFVRGRSLPAPAAISLASGRRESSDRSTGRSTLPTDEHAGRRRRTPRARACARLPSSDSVWTSTNVERGLCKPTSRAVLGPAVQQSRWTIRLRLLVATVHELRHKRHAPRLYAQIRALLSSGTEFIVCDHLPDIGPTPRHRRLYMSTTDNLAELANAGFSVAEVAWCEHEIALYRARA
jgi:hypothetical protein